MCSSVLLFSFINLVDFSLIVVWHIFYCDYNTFFLFKGSKLLELFIFVLIDGIGFCYITCCLDFVNIKVLTTVESAEFDVELISRLILFVMTIGNYLKTNLFMVNQFLINGCPIKISYQNSQLLSIPITATMATSIVLNMVYNCKQFPITSLITQKNMVAIMWFIKSFYGVFCQDMTSKGIGS